MTTQALGSDHLRPARHRHAALLWILAILSMVAAAAVLARAPALVPLASTPALP